MEKIDIKNKEIDFNKNIVNEFDEKINELDIKIDKKSEQHMEKETKSFLKFYILNIVFFILTIVSFIIKLSSFIPIVLSTLFITSIVLTFVNINKFKNEKRKKLNEIEEFEKRINQEIDILNKNKEAKLLEIERKENKLNEELNLEKRLISKKYENDIDPEFLQAVLEFKQDEVLMSVSNKEDRINALRLELNTKEIDKNNMIEKLENLSKFEEELQLLYQEREDIISLNKSFNIAKECMEEAYKKIRDSLNPEFTSELCNLISNISNNKYSNIKFSDTEGLTVEIDNGRYIPAERLSLGTIDQMYLALRLSTLKVVSKENMPIILDESFAYFDNERLTNIMKFIECFYKNRQVIILTCSNREKEILKELNIEYKLIELET